jgi:hypothetical protein
MAQDTAFETEMRLNRVALSPLLIKRQGVLRAQVETWCTDVCKNVEKTRRALHFEIPSLSEHESLPFELIKSHARKLMSLGLSNGRSSNIEGWLSDDIHALMRSIDIELTARENMAVNAFVAQRACLIAQDEPSPRGHKLQDIIEQRKKEAEAKVLRSQRDVNNAAGEMLKALKDDNGLYQRERLALLHQLTLHGPAPRPVRRPRRYVARVRAWMPVGTIPLPDPIELLIDETILLLRHELLKDITSTAEDPQLSTWGASRARSIRAQAKELKRQFADATPCNKGDGFRGAYPRAAFSRGRNSIMNNWLPT